MEEEFIAEAARDILAREFDRVRLHALYDGDGAVADRVWSLAVEMGWLTASIPEASGGLGLPPDVTLALLREFGRCAAPGALLPACVAALWAGRVEGTGLASAIGDGLRMGTLRLAMPALDLCSRIDIAGGRATGRLHGAIGGSGVTAALLPAWHGGEGAVALVDLSADGTFTPGGIWDRTRVIGDIACDNSPVIAILPDRDGVLFDDLLTALRLAIAADSVGGMQAVRGMTVHYMCEREQFGRAIGSFQALKHRVANCYVGEQAATKNFTLASRAFAADARDAAVLARMAKADAGAAYLRNAEESLLLHGGVGFTWEFDCHIYLKRARLNAAVASSEQENWDSAFAMLGAMAGEACLPGAVAA